MIPKKSEELDEELRAAEEALKAAQEMSVGPERISALKKAGKMRFKRKSLEQEETPNGKPLIRFST